MDDLALDANPDHHLFKTNSCRSRPFTSAAYKISRDIDTSLRQKGEQLLEQGVLSSHEETHEEQLVQFSQWWEEYNDAGKANLAKYIVNRKLMLELLEDALKRQATGKYSREELVHRIVFPLRRTSDDVAYDEHNLWIVDEKLAYHAYLASDLPLNKVQPLDSDSASRPDLIFFFDRAIAVVDGEHPYGSGIVVFEFKRPMRDDYSEADNPIQQVLRYVEEIKAGKARTKDGRPLNVPDRTPFYCYVVCDLTPRLKEQARFASLRTTPDGNGYFGFNDEVGAYIEVIGFDKLVQDANKRNRVLFEKLNLPDRLPASRNASREN